MTGSAPVTRQEPPHARPRLPKRCLPSTGRIRSKDGAAQWALGELPEEHRPVPVAARDQYLAGEYGGWADLLPAARVHAAYVAEAIKRACSA
ncbi:aminoglycoside adenylyltransferase domain-containing protein [Streptomyces narbonensis]|uniref:aminoglycoside adenylyltransferase domain-containing protein n=1 Tax=Streptomyces narbonensis TaxID=67333 RepID=UPI00167B5DD1|nr:aminoglycoside adenylyltransferase domain-containing protein [Streptomyces narbonensis]GGV98476.1 hypothetical protein GCM10010230_22110 [Streptomyces narbonensis]